MLSISIGPFAFPANSLLLFISAYLAYFFLLRNKGQDKAFLEKLFWTTLVIALVSARLVYLALHFDSYKQSIWAIFDIRDGGWWSPAGVVSSLLFVTWAMWRHALFRKALFLAYLLSVGTWGLGSGWLHYLQTSNSLEQANKISLVSFADSGTQTLPTIIASKPSVINLWASWCGPCKQEMPYFAKLQKQYPQVEFVFVNQAEKPAAIQRYLAQQSFQIKGIWLDTQGQLGPAVGSNGLPTTLFVDAKGNLVNAHFGTLNEAALDAAIQNLLTE